MESVGLMPGTPDTQPQHLFFPQISRQELLGCLANAPDFLQWTSLPTEPVEEKRSCPWEGGLSAWTPSTGLRRNLPVSGE